MRQLIEGRRKGRFSLHTSGPIFLAAWPQGLTPPVSRLEFWFGSVRPPALSHLTASLNDGVRWVMTPASEWNTVIGAVESLLLKGLENLKLSVALLAFD